MSMGQLHLVLECSYIFLSPVSIARGAGEENKEEEKEDEKEEEKERRHHMFIPIKNWRAEVQLTSGWLTLI